MSGIFQYNKVYSIEQGVWRESKLAQGVQKISVVSDAGLVEQVSSLAKLLDGFSQIAFIPRQGNYGEYWELFAPDSIILKLKERLADSSFDYLTWPQNQQSAPELLLFDMDSTFIEIEVIDQLAAHHQVGDKVAAVTELAMQGELDFAESLIERVACLKGLSTQAIDEIKATLPISAGITTLVEAAHKNDAKIAIVSGGFTPFVETLKASLGLHKVKANHLQIENSALTGKVEGDIVDAEAKAIFLEELASELDIDLSKTMAIGDGANDLKMMSVSGFNLAYRAKPKVQAAAAGRFNRVDFERLVDLFGW